MIAPSLASNRVACAALVVALAAAACAAADPVGPTTMAFDGQGTLAADATVGVVPCTIPGGETVSAFPALLRSTGEFTGMGTTLGEIRATACTVDPATGSLTVAGDVLQTGTDGASLDATFTATLQSTGTYALDVTVVGGTGRFGEATGRLTGGEIIDPTTGAGTFQLSGELTV